MRCGGWSRSVPSKQRGDAGHTVRAIIAAADNTRPPLRLPLGSTAYENLTPELARRLAEIEAQREVAFSADRT